jgi:aldehyde dehydrogenase (NAD+)
MAIAADSSSDLFIDGSSSGGSGRYPTINPATEEVLGTAADGGDADMERAIGAARRAFDDTDWSTDTELRVRCIRQLRECHEGEHRGTARADHRRGRAPRMLTSMAQLEGPVDDLSFCADTAETYEWRQDLGFATPMGIKTRRTIAREAVGVVGAITPWNFPHQINLAKLGPALAAGNTIVLKPAPDTPWCAAVLGELIAEHTDIPPGVVNIVTSNDHAVGALLSSDPRVDMVSFTGSTATGRVMAAGATPSRRCSSNSAASRRSWCSTTPTWPAVLDVGVHRLDARRAGLRDHHPAGGAAGSYDEAVEAAAATMGGTGRVTRPTPHRLRPISERQRDRVQSISTGDRRGRPVRLRWRRPPIGTGFFIEPTVIAGLDNTARVAREEIFGPV